jgi:Holliday junction resolvase RusA-like endonuclease
VTAYTWTVEGRCVPWQRTTSHAGRRLTPRAQRAYQRHVRATVAACTPLSWPRDMWYAVELVVYEPDARRRDLDNQAKTVVDALTGVLWDDDSQVDVLAIVRRLDRKQPRVVLGVAPLALSERDHVTVEITIGGQSNEPRGAATPGAPDRPRGSMGNYRTGLRGAQ